MKISIIIPSYNQGRFLDATLASIFKQGIDDIEVIVNDGGSTDNSVEILRSYASRIRWRSASDRGQTDAINRGLREASGDILAYLNSDDVYLPGALAEVLAHFDAHPDCMVLYGSAHHLHEDGTFMEEYPTKPWDYDTLFDTCYICQPAAFWRRSIHSRFGFFDERLHYSMDYEFWLRVGAQTPFHFLDRPALAGSRLHCDTKTLRHRIPCHREILSTIRHHASSASQTYSWLKHLASLQAIEDGVPPSADPIRHRHHVLRFVRNVLTIAEQQHIPLNELILGELEQLMPAHLLQS